LCYFAISQKLEKSHTLEGYQQSLSGIYITVVRKSPFMLTAEKKETGSKKKLPQRAILAWIQGRESRYKAKGVALILFARYLGIICCKRVQNRPSRTA